MSTSSGSRVRRDVPVLGRRAAEQITHASTDDPSALALLAEAPADVEHIFGDLIDEVYQSPVDRYEVRFRKLVLLIILVLLALIIGYVIWSVMADRPVTYSNITEHFKYGSIGSEPASPLPKRFESFPRWKRSLRSIPVTSLLRTARKAFLPGQGGNTFSICS